MISNTMEVFVWVGRKRYVQQLGVTLDVGEDEAFLNWTFHVADDLVQLSRLQLHDPHMDLLDIEALSGAITLAANLDPQAIASLPSGVSIGYQLQVGRWNVHIWRKLFSHERNEYQAFFLSVDEREDRTRLLELSLESALILAETLSFLSRSGIESFESVS